MVDGIHANGFGDLRIVSSVGAWRLWESTVINAAADNMTLAAFLRERRGSRGRAAAKSRPRPANGDFGAFVGRSMGIEGAAVAAGMGCRRT